jgi:hypothetical protein
VGQAGNVAEGVGVRVLKPVDERCVVQVGVEVHDVERLAESPHDGKADGVVAADDDRHRSLPKDLAGHAGDVAEGVDDVGGQDVGVADVDDPTLQHLVLEEVAPRFGVVVAGAAGDEAHGVLPDRAGAEARAWHERRALVGGDAHDGDVGIELAQVGADRRSQERGDADERRVQPSRAVVVVHRTLGHPRPPAMSVCRDVP